MLSFAELELDILSKANKDPENRPLVEEFIPEILALVDKFSKSGQSGGSAPYYASAIAETVKKLCLIKPISPITGIDEEWCEFTLGSFQNSRCYSLFKDENGFSYYLDAIQWKTQKGYTYSGSAYLREGEKIKAKFRSRQYIKGFPFVPKTFVVDVVEEEIAKDDWEFYIKDENQLNEVFEYYQYRVVE